ncbi:MAG: VWA domain-containing protein [Brachymonas sp.]|nr:VWA domain-containing protein [Brachymonas sp.]
MATQNPTHPRRRLLPVVLAVSLVFSGFGAPAQAQRAAPIAKPMPSQQGNAPKDPVRLVARSQPDFAMPSANDCNRAPVFSEIPGRTPQEIAHPAAPIAAGKGKAALGGARYGYTGRAGADTMLREVARASAAAPAPAVPAAMEAKEAPALHKQALAKHSPAPQIAVDQRVTAGVVDDNADFAEYLAFRDRTDVPHRVRDVRQRYRLQVRDADGRNVPDAQVTVRGSSGAHWWGRTDAAGQLWVMPDSFDPQPSPRYQVTVKHAHQTATATLARGQKNAVDVQLAAPQQQARKAQLDIVFLIDATGSMQDEIDKLKSSLQSISRQIAQLPSQPSLCYSLIAYRDKGDEYLLRSYDFTNRLNAFQQALNGLQASGGGDMPESMGQALHTTVHKLSWRGAGTTRLVIALADAPPHLDYGAPYYDDAMLSAVGKGIKVFSVGASGLDKQGEFIQRQIAQYTGGKFVFLTYAQASNPSSGAGTQTVHDVQNYSVDTLDSLIVRLVREELQNLPAQTMQGAQKLL